MKTGNGATKRFRITERQFNLAATGIFAAISFTILSCAESPGQQPKQYIYARSSTQTTSRFLGVTSVPAYITLGGTNRRGVYVTATGSSGLWRDMRLKPGTMLLTLDNRVIENGSTADSLLAGKGVGSVDYTMVVMAGGLPKVVSGSVHFNPFTAGGGVTVSGGGYSQAKGAPQFSITELERHGVELINDSRRREGRGAGSVSESPALTRLARSYAEYMLKTGNKAHIDLEGRNPQDRAREAGLKVGVYENYTWDTRNSAPDDKLIIAGAHKRMMDEPPNQQNHRSNILDEKHQYVGVGIARDTNNLYMIHEFADSSP